MKKRFAIPFVTLLFSLLLSLPFSVAAQLNEIAYVSVLADGTTVSSREDSYPSVTEDGKYVVFNSTSENLGASFKASQIFIKNMESGKLTLLSVSNTGEIGNGSSDMPHITGDGRYVLFSSMATNLLGNDPGGNPIDSNGSQDVFLIDRANPSTGLVDDDETNNKIIRVSVNLQGNQIKPAVGTAASRTVPNAITEDGAFVVFQTHANGTTMSGDGVTITDNNSQNDVYLWSRATGKSTLISHVPNDPNKAANHASNWASISSDGQTIVFQSQASDITTVADPDNTVDIILYDVRTKAAKRISVTTAGAEEPGRNQTPKISPSGKFLAFTAAGILDPNDQNLIEDVYLYDVQQDKLALIPSYRFGADEPKYLDATEMNYAATVSDDGRYVVFAARSYNLVPGKMNLNIGDVFAHDMLTGNNIRLTVSRSGDEGMVGNSNNVLTDITKDGKYAVFSSTVGGLDPNVPDPTANTNIFFVELDWIAPTVESHSLQAFYQDIGPASLTVTFNEPMTKTDTFFPFAEQKMGGADYLGNYLIVGAGADGVVDYARCGDPFDPAKDTLIATDTVDYDNSTYTTTVNFNGGVELGLGKYRFLACGNSPFTYAGPSLHDGVGNKMAADFVFDFEVGVKPEPTKPAPTPSGDDEPLLPDTGFSSNEKP